MFQSLLVISFLLSPLASLADSYENLKVDKVGPLEKVGPLDPIGPSKETKPTTAPVSSASPVKETVEPVDLSSSRSPTSPSDDSIDVLEQMSFGGHKKGGGDSDSGAAANETVMKAFFTAGPSFSDLNSAKVLAPIEPTERDAPQGMVKVSQAEPQNKNPRMNFPAQAGGCTGSCCQGK